MYHDLFTQGLDLFNQWSNFHYQNHLIRQSLFRRGPGLEGTGAGKTRRQWTERQRDSSREILFYINSMVSKIKAIKIYFFSRLMIFEQSKISYLPFFPHLLFPIHCLKLMSGKNVKSSIPNACPLHRSVPSNGKLPLF